MSAEPENIPNSGEEARDPSGFLSEIIGAPVTVKLNSGVVYKGASRLKLSKITTSC
jgi:U6 snRNA-associated Sm-like protein LSm6